MVRASVAVHPRPAAPVSRAPLRRSVLLPLALPLLAGACAGHAPGGDQERRAQGPAAGPAGELPLVADGRVAGPGVFAAGGAFEERADAVAATGHDEVLWALARLSGGDFTLRARLRLEGAPNAAASVQIDEDHLGLEGARGTVFTNGPRIGPLELGPVTRTVVDPGEWFDLAVRRRGTEVALLLDGVEVAREELGDGPVERLGFRPWRATVVLSEWSLVGDLEPLEPADLVDPPAWELPWVDLAGDDSVRTVVDREEGQYLGHPTTLLIEDGRTVLCVYPQGHGRGAIVYKRSTDGGRTWSERLPTPASWETSKETPTLFRTVDADGTRRVLLFSGLYPARMAVSEDDGATWSELEPVGDWGGIVVMGAMVALRSGAGHYAAFFHDDGRCFRAGGAATGVFTLYQTNTTDGGLTWSDPRAIHASSELHLCEPGVVRSPDGERLALLLRENARGANSHVVFSDDEARTWGAPQPLPGALNGDRHTAVYTDDGRLFVSFRDVQPRGLSSPTAGDWVAWIGTWRDLAEGRAGEYRVRLGDNTKGADCAYPGVERLPDGTILTTTYGHWDRGEPPYVVAVRVRLDELEARLEEQR